MSQEQNPQRAVVRLSRADKSDAVEVLALAFHNYPLMRYVLKDAGTAYEEHLRALIGFFVESRLTRDWPLLGVREGGMLAAVAAANSPGEKPRPKVLQEVYERMTKLIGLAATERLEEFERVTDGFVPDTPYYYLGMIGVRPGLQRGGLARVLLDHLHAMSEADPASTGVCLSTELASNVPLYEHFGYKVLGDADTGELHTWGMFRGNART